MATAKQKKLLGKILENIGDTSKTKTMGEMLRESGYATSMSEDPGKILAGKGFQKLMDEFVPDSLLTQIGLSGLSATKRDVFTGELQNDWQTIFKFWKEFLDRKHPIEPPSPFGKLGEQVDKVEVSITLKNNQNNFIKVNDETDS